MTDDMLLLGGYRLLRLFAYEQTCQMTDPDEIDESMPDRSFNVYWNWHPSGYREFSVWLGVFIQPSSDVPEKVRVAYIADFSINDDEPEIPLDGFVIREAPSLIYPYVREAVSSLTGRGIAGPYVLAAYDIRETIAAEFQFAESTGVEMLRNAEEAEAFGFSVSFPTKQTKRKTREKQVRTKRK